MQAVQLPMALQSMLLIHQIHKLILLHKLVVMEQMMERLQLA